MSWFRLDDKSWSHVKVIAAGNAAWGAFCRLGAYAADHLTDGVIPSSIAQLVASIDETERLVAVGLLTREGDGSYRLHDYLRYNPKARDVKKKRDEVSRARSQAGKIGGKKSALTRAATPKQTGKQAPKQTAEPLLKQNEAPDPVPIPSRSPSKKPESAALGKVERPDGQVWRIFKAAYAAAFRREYVRDASRDGKAAQAVSHAADEHAKDVAEREALLAFWCERYLVIEGDSWLESNGFPLHAMARALPRIGLPSTAPERTAPDERKDVVTDPEELERIRREAHAGVDIALRKRTPFLFDDPPKEATS